MFWHAVRYFRIVFVSTDVAVTLLHNDTKKKLFLTSSISCKQNIMNGTFERKKIITLKKLNGFATAKHMGVSSVDDKKKLFC